MNECKTFWLAVSILFAILFLCAAVIFLPMPVTGEKYADMVIPFILGSGFGVIIAMYFGTSEGSKAKNTTIAKLVADQVPPGDKP